MLDLPCMTSRGYHRELVAAIQEVNTGPTAHTVTAFDSHLVRTVGRDDEPETHIHHVVLTRVMARMEDLPTHRILDRDIHPAPTIRERSDAYNGIGVLAILRRVNGSDVGPLVIAHPGHRIDRARIIHRELTSDRNVQGHIPTEGQCDRRDARTPVPGLQRHKGLNLVRSEAHPDIELQGVSGSHAVRMDVHRTGDQTLTIHANHPVAIPTDASRHERNTSQAVLIHTYQGQHLSFTTRSRSTNLPASRIFRNADRSPNGASVKTGRDTYRIHPIAHHQRGQSSTGQVRTLDPHPMRGSRYQDILQGIHPGGSIGGVVVDPMDELTNEQVHPLFRRIADLRDGQIDGRERTVHVQIDQLYILSSQ